MEFKKYSKKITVNGIKLDAEVTVEVRDDEYADLMDQDFENEAQRDAYQAKVNSGSIFAGSIIVIARAEGLEGIDSLGGCELSPNNMFNSKPFEQSVGDYLKGYGMEANALNELKRNLEQEYEQLNSRAAELAVRAQKQFKKFSKGKYL